MVYRFYREKLKLKNLHEHSILVQFVNRMLTNMERRDMSILDKLFYAWQVRKNSRKNDDDEGTLTSLIIKEAQKHIAKDPELSAVMEGADRSKNGKALHWFRFVNKVSNTMLAHLSKKLVRHLTGANPFDLFSTIGSAGTLITLTAPYFVIHTLAGEERKMSQEACLRFGLEVKGNREPKVAVFTDTFEEVNGVARSWNRMRRLAHQSGKSLTVITCTDDPEKSR